MKRYQFGLQKVLEYDRFLQRNEADAMGRLQAEYVRLQREHDRLLGQFAQSRTEYLTACEKGLSAAKIASVGRYISDLSDEIEKSRLRMERHLEKLEAQRKKLVAATQDKEILEKLREQSLEDYHAEERKSDELFIEDFISNRTAQGET